MGYINLWLKWVGWRDWKFQLYWSLISTGSAVNFSFIQVVACGAYWHTQRGESKPNRIKNP